MPMNFAKIIIVLLLCFICEWNCACAQKCDTLYSASENWYWEYVARDFPDTLYADISQTYTLRIDSEFKYKRDRLSRSSDFPYTILKIKYEWVYVWTEDSRFMYAEFFNDRGVWIGRSYVTDEFVGDDDELYAVLPMVLDTVRQSFMGSVMRGEGGRKHYAPILLSRCIVVSPIRSTPPKEINKDLG